MNDGIAGVFAIWLGITTTFAINFIITDYRNFDQLVKACETTGHVEDTKTRIICAIEKTVDRN